MPVKGLYRSQGRIFNPPTENEAPIIVDSADGNKIKVWRGGTGDTAPVTLLTTGDEGPEGKVGYHPGEGGTVTQTGSSTTAVTLNKLCGSINTQQFNTVGNPGGGTEAFIVNNTFVAEDDLIILNWVYNGNTGSPNVTANLTSAGFFAIQVWNYNVTSNLNGSFLITFAVIGGSTV